MYDWQADLNREARLYNKKYSKVYKTERGLWSNQSSGSLECLSTTQDKLTEAINEYNRSNDWN